jgi:hypothetical protein
MRSLVPISVLCAALAWLTPLLDAQDKRPAPPPPAPSIAGAWTRNADLSDTPAGRGQQGEEGGRGGSGRGGGGGGRHGGGGGGGFGGGFGRGGGMGRGGDTARGNPDEMIRMRDAARDVTNPPEHLTITQTESMIVVTGADGHTTRLAPTGKKIKDENTNVERKTRWDGGRLVSEVNGLVGRGKTTQTFAVDPDTHQLRITIATEGEPKTMSYVYDADAK